MLHYIFLTKPTIMRKLVYLILLIPFMMVAQGNDSFLLNLSEITVKSGHDAQFTEGIKAWKKCYLDNEGKDKWNIWRRVQGEGSVYVFSSTMAKWAEMDDQGDEAGKDCQMKVVNLIMPHVKRFNYNIARSMPNLSRSGALPEDTKLVWVYNVKTNNGSSFREAVSELVGAMKKVEGDSRGIWYDVQGGGPDAPNYFVSIPFKNFADMDVDRDGVWNIYEKANGKAKTDALRSKFRSAVTSDWSYMYSLNEELSNR
ncbi:hypothetical protein OE09_0898 [Flavobacteriaceae bacterium MAR_2010_72]|nr:hypothetical protein OE09_0898 [Flavobacteriaceae bacterium MAR_2010_72]